MDKSFDIPVSAVCVHPTKSNVVALGFLDGQIRCASFNLTKGKLKSLWATQLKRAVRGLGFSQDGQQLYVIGVNWSLCVYDAATGERVRCIQKAHEGRPNKLFVLPATANSAQIATGADDGEIKLWDFRKETPNVASFHDQEDIINAFAVYKHLLLAASGDSTLAAYDFRKCKLKVVSEGMHSELMSIAVTERFTYVGGADGYIEVFISGQYGNILERIETSLPMGVDSLIALRPQLLLAGSAMQDEMWFLHVNPNNELHAVQQFGGVDELHKSHDSEYLVAVGCDYSTLTVRRLPEMIDPIPTMASTDLGALVKKEKSSKKLTSRATDAQDFYKDLCSSEAKEEVAMEEVKEEVKEEAKEVAKEEAMDAE